MKANHQRMIDDWWADVRAIAIKQGANADDVDKQIKKDRIDTDREVGLLITHEETEDWVPNMLIRMAVPSDL